MLKSLLFFALVLPFAAQAGDYDIKLHKVKCVSEVSPESKQAHELEMVVRIVPYIVTFNLQSDGTGTSNLKYEYWIQQMAVKINGKTIPEKDVIVTFGEGRKSSARDTDSLQINLSVHPHHFQVIVNAMNYKGGGNLLILDEPVESLSVTCAKAP